MRKTRFIALVLVVALMLVGAGYAAWNEKLFVDTTVRTGYFDMEITKAETRSGDDQIKNYYDAKGEVPKDKPWSQYDWTHDTGAHVTNNGNSVTVEFYDLYPGGRVQLDLVTTNKGKIPAKLKAINVKFRDGDRKLFNALQAQTSWKADITGDNQMDDWEHVNDWKNWLGIKEELEVELIESLNNNKIVIEPNGWLAFDSMEDEPGCFVFRLDPEAGNYFQNKSCTFDIEFEWEQWSNTPEKDNFWTYGGVGKGKPNPDPNGDKYIQTPTGDGDNTVIDKK